MRPADVLQARLSHLTGARHTPSETASLAKAIPRPLPAWVLELLLRFPVAGTNFVLDSDQDPSGLGVEMKWLKSDQIADEATAVYPGIPALAMGYLPIGMCMSGSGDPYFISLDRGEDPPVVRIPHDAVKNDTEVDENRIETVASSLSEFLRQARIEH